MRCAVLGLAVCIGCSDGGSGSAPVKAEGEPAPDVAALEARVSDLESELETLRAEFLATRSQAELQGAQVAELFVRSQAYQEALNESYAATQALSGRLDALEVTVANAEPAQVETRVAELEEIVNANSGELSLLYEQAFHSLPKSIRDITDRLNGFWLTIDTEYDGLPGVEVVIRNADLRLLDGQILFGPREEE